MLGLADFYGHESGNTAIIEKTQALREILENWSITKATKIPSSCVPHGYSTPIPETTWQRMQGRSWHRGRKCPAREALVLVHIPFIDFDGKSQVGKMVLAKSVSAKVLSAFSEIYKSGFQIAAMDLVDKYNGDDSKSMAANNSSAFNCRSKTGGRGRSEHSLGTAIDLNPIQNPYVTSTLVEPKEGVSYASVAQRAKEAKGLIRPDGPVVNAFSGIGWGWGGTWTSVKDYQHFSESGR